ncbi:MAG: UDP-N-acetylmuramoyl-L-alanine--D-glutamate ligase [Corynebacterium sp.]|uniref:UDP-N-acetylmuramoyl-L-alanine--D-glutamate ligase n=1 Tax=Corynebacterium sp. TaxID=1720 RepID=UPI0026E02B7C|nr:UDP-N-acetylmuramoyl-L-alanine--D-glutamate ligase [Corynebacterium sp.]MDO5668823.1 UDP-N-acetylmuramoyl-L-alanine--D-glutamate ligase [Corynebacterium sp.]
MIHGTALIAGAGVSGRGIARLLDDLGVSVVVADDSGAGIPTSEVRQRLSEFEVLVTSPGWRPDNPLLIDAAAAGLEVIGDVELCYRLDREGAFGAPRRWLVVTGTNGKTTTTAMLAAMMQQMTPRAQAVGNIGVSVADALSDPERVEVLVAELSSFQLHWSTDLTPDAGVLLNLAEDHIDWHGSFVAYADAKARALRGPVAVAGIDDPEVRAVLARAGVDKHVGFTLGEPGLGQFGVIGGQLVDNTGDAPVILAPVAGIQPTGPAGVLDALAAAAIARSQGAQPEHIAAALADFQVDGHRGQTVAQGGGVAWVDNSKATNPHAADAALAGLDNVIWIAGGQLKGADIVPLIRDHAHRMKGVGLLGVDAPLIAAALREHAPDLPVHTATTTDPAAAMEELVSWAGDLATEGDTVLLAPAAASLDMYTGMAQRGDIFAAAAGRQS